MPDAARPAGLVTATKDSLDMAVARRGRRILHIFVGVLIGAFCAQMLRITPSCDRFEKPPTPEFNPVAVDDTESGLVFVGVMTAAKYLTSRATAVYRTWGLGVPGKIIFFSSQFSRSEHLPLVALPHVDDSYPPQKKSFMMLQYMYEHFGDKFEWFLRADDDVYIRTDRLEVFLRSIDSNKPQFIGQAGRGNNEEFGLLSLEYDENFCMGGPGIIMSRETLKRIAPHIDYCLKNLYTTHEDVELGRCVQKFAGIPCTWSYEMQSILYHNQSGAQAFTGILKTSEVHRAISLHPVKHPAYMYRLHNYFKELKIQGLKQSTVEIKREMGRVRDQMPDVSILSDNQSDHYGISEVTSGLNRHKPKGLEDVLQWDFIARSLYTSVEVTPRRRIDVALRQGLEDVIREVMETINKFSKQRGRVINFREVLYAYKRLDPTHGVDWVLDLLLVYRKYRGHKMTVPVRRHAYVQQTFTGMEIREIPLDESASYEDSPLTVQAGSASGASQYYDLHHVLHQSIQHLKSLNLLPPFLSSRDNSYARNTGYLHDKRINFILPLAGRFETFQRFLRYYEEVCLKNLENVRLFVILYVESSSAGDYSRSIDLLKKLNGLYRYSELQVVEMGDREFSRGEALQVGVRQCSSDDLMVFIDVDIIFNSESLLRIRLNTIRNRQVYFPIVFSEYDPKFGQIKYEQNECNVSIVPSSVSTTSVPFIDTDVYEISDQNGYWRKFGYGIASVYKSDLETIGGLNTSIHGWGLEDVYIYEKFVTSSPRNLAVFRAADPGLVHVYHSIECKETLSEAQKNMCYGSRANTLASQSNLYMYLLANPEILNRFYKESGDNKNSKSTTKGT